MEEKDLTVSDSVLVAQARGGDGEAFDALVRTHYGTAFAIGLAHLRDRDEAEDLAQEVFLRAFLQLGQLKDGEKFAPWLGRMARNLAIDWQRRGASRQRLAPQVPLDDLPHDPPDERRPDARRRLEENRSASILMEHIERLPVHLRELVLLYYMEELTQEEIAGIQGITQGAVASRLKTALRKLHGALEPLMREGLGSLRSTPGSVARAVILVAALSSLPELARAALAAQVAQGAGAAPAGGTLFTKVSEGLSSLREFLSSHLLAAAAGGGALVMVAALFLTLHSRHDDLPRQFRPYRTDTFDQDTAGVSPAPASAPAGRPENPAAPPAPIQGWMPFGVTREEIAGHDFDARNGALRVTLRKDIPGLRRAGWWSPGSEGMPLSAVGENNFVRVKHYIYASGQDRPERLDEIPNLSFRAATRFAVSSELEVFHHQSTDPGNNSLAREPRPSTDPKNPSLYRVDFAPVRGPWLRLNARREGILRAFLAVATDPQMNGGIGLAESVIGTYPSALAAERPPLKVYAPDTTSAGTLGSRGGDLVLHTGLIPRDLDRIVPGEDRATSDPLPSYSEGPWGVTFDTTAIPSDRLGVVSREFWPGDDLAARVRVEPDRQYAIRFHVTSTRPASSNAIVRLRARSVKFGWVQKLDLLGAWGTGGPATEGNNAIAQQALPGLGSGNPDQRTPGEPGGWYTLLMTSPLNAGIRPEFPEDTPLALRMPGLCSEPGPGDNRPSRRDLVVGADLIDTLSRGPNAGLEMGHMTIDRIEVYSAPLVRD